MLWGLHPTILFRMIQAAVLPALFYAASAWSTVIRFRTRLRSLDRVLRLCGICTLGLLRTVSHDAACMLAGFLPAEFFIRQCLVQFYLRQLTYDRDLLAPDDTHRRLNPILSPRDVLHRELLQLETSGHASQSMCRRVERRLYWPTDPSFSAWAPSVTILDRDAAISQFRQAREKTSSDTLWIFTDGSLDGFNCGAAAVIFRGATIEGQPVSLRFVGLHSTTQVELVAIKLGCEHTLPLGYFSSIILVCDSQSALLGLGTSQGCSQLSAQTRRALHTLSLHTSDLRIWWVPGHVGISEHDLADDTAKKAACSDTVPYLFDVPFCATILKCRIRAHYVSRTTDWWNSFTQGHDLRQVLPSFSSDLSWTATLSRKEAALVAQFLTGHYPSQSYLRRFGHPVDGSCLWCNAPTDDRVHRLIHCPRFDYHRQRLSQEISSRSRGTFAWTWDYLVSKGRRYLAKFLLIVRAATS